MAWDKNTLISTHDVTAPIRDAILAQGPRGFEFMVLASGGETTLAGMVNATTAIDAALAETLLARGPRAVEMAKFITGENTP
jgi:hypothetical protein